MHYDRVPDQRWREPIGRALRLVRPWRHIMGDVRFVCGVDPVFAGLHQYRTTEAGRSYGETAHCCYDSHLAGRPRAERYTTVVLPVPVSAVTVVHELGHALDGALGFKVGPSSEVSEYASTNREERFAEFFTAQIFHYGDHDAWASDPFRHELDALKCA